MGWDGTLATPVALADECVGESVILESGLGGPRGLKTDRRRRTANAKPGTSGQRRTASAVRDPAQRDGAAGRLLLSLHFWLGWFQVLVSTLAGRDAAALEQKIGGLRITASASLD